MCRAMPALSQTSPSPFSRSFQASLRSSETGSPLALRIATWLTAFALVGGLAPAQSGAADLMVCASRNQAEVAKAVQEFETATGLDLKIAHASSRALTEKLVADAKDSTCDVIWLAEAGWFGELARKQVLAPLPQSLLDQADPRLRDKAGKWIGTSAALRTIVYNPDLIEVDALPASLTALVSEAYEGKIAWAPKDPGFVAYVSGLRRAWTNEKARLWMQAIAASQPKVFENEREILAAIENDEAAIGLLSSGTVLATRTETSKAQILSLPQDADPGKMLLLSGVGLRAGTAQAEGAAKFLDFLLSEAVQDRLPEQALEYAARLGVAPPKGLPTLDQLAPVSIEQAWLVDTEPTLELMKNAGL